MKGRVTLRDAVRFHGHLGPYLVLGLLAGEAALKKLSCKKYFGLKVRVWGADKKPKSCLIDGLQLSTGATYGKGNIHKTAARTIKIRFSDKNTGKAVCLELKKDLIKKLDSLTTHEDSELLAKKLYHINLQHLFNWR